ncbi:MAG: ABC transporter ATP-binding protein [Anaerolineae bacterium]|nr:ABC transporter ATP-binding protein [Anaerolineae bacterium]
MTVLLEARNVTKIFRSGLITKKETVALEDFSLTIDPEQPSIMAVVGESGSGKTTMARLLLGLEAPTEGEVFYQGKPLTRLRRAEWLQFRRDVQAVFQDPFEVYNTFYRVDHALEVPIQKFRLAESRAQMRRLMEEALDAVGLRPAETLGRYPHQLSGGQRQRIMVARALLLKPKLIIADEPVSMIDASLRATVLENLRNLNERFGISIIYITHDLTTAYQISHNIVVLYRGAVAEVGDVSLVVKEPRHPYTQLLVGSIPLPDPNRPWREQPEPSPLAEEALANVGCKFAARCAHTFAPCLERAPLLYRTDQFRAAACYLHDTYPPLRPEEMERVLIEKLPLYETA